MTRTLFDFRAPNWIKFGVVVYATDVTDRDKQIQAIAGDATVTITEERPATAREVERHAVYVAWLAKWMEAARTGQAGRHMAHPPALAPVGEGE